MSLTTRRIVYANFISKPVRNFGLALLIAVVAFVLLVGGLFSTSLDAGFEQLSARMGADVLVIPRGSDAKEQPILLQGDLSHKVMPRAVLDAARKIPGVKVASPHFYLTTLGASCCDKKVNIIGFDSRTDFTIKPWIRETYQKDFPVGAVIAGSDIRKDVSGKIKFFDQEFTVVASLEPMGNRLDQAIFADEATVALIRKAAEAKGYRFVSEGEISAILIKLEKNTDFDLLNKELHSQFDDLQLVARKDMFGSVISTVVLFNTVIWIVAVFFLLTAIASVYIAFSISVNERKKEFATLRIIGATRKKLRQIVLGESRFVGILGSVSGVFLGSLVFFPFRIFIGDSLNVPFLLPEMYVIVLTFVIALLLPVFAGVGAAYGVARKVGRLDVYAALKEEL